jgi:hypothetical protein
MATGRQAFSGETAAALRDAILNRTPVSARQLNPEVPAKLEEIINKAIEKDRGLRYQHAADICADLKRLKRDTEPAHGAAPGFSPATGHECRPLAGRLSPSMVT